ncbi:hypothetical protein L226DRAFT_80038 [Lentinus tigrinus ALCF2SS1-7]|uniref:uncharacterized protein n=1 Tax=Lentinus tigrinus ALCF2SS1-7 TaxID=1328758 RepID=UPI001165DB19|nr:hypothetical protein L226DRAFT_80038 [Lentinus tigrinus ALCF2SS1-7]
MTRAESREGLGQRADSACDALLIRPPLSRWLQGRPRPPGASLSPPPRIRAVLASAGDRIAAVSVSSVWLVPSARGVSVCAKLSLPFSV